MRNHNASTLPPPTSPRDVIAAAMAEAGTVRVHIREQGRSGPAQTYEGRPVELIKGRDDRERVVLSLMQGNEPVQIRVPLERVVRAERLAVGASGRAGRNSIASKLTLRFDARAQRPVSAYPPRVKR